MEHRTITQQVLDLLNRPAFLAKDGKVIQLNTAASQRMVHPGDAVEDLLLTGHAEYAAFSQGTLYLTLTVYNQSCGACVTAFDGGHLFILEDDRDPALQAMALAGRELREPLNAIMATADQLFPKLSGDPEAEKQLASINRGLYRLLRLTLNMTDAHRFDREGSQQLQIRDICDILNQIFAKAEDSCRQAGFTLEHPILRETVYCSVDEDLLERAIYNLLSNSMKFAPREAPIRIHVQRKGTQLCITVEDSGRGIPADIQKNLFARYLRTPVLEDGLQGMGLGMVLVREAAKIHGGAVLAEPCAQGSKITLTLSLAQWKETYLHSGILSIDYAGERSHTLLELSGALPADSYQVDSTN